jgi:hypothetical protein
MRAPAENKAGRSRRDNRRCRACGVYSEQRLDYCSDECRANGTDLMPEEIEAILATRQALRAQGLLPRHQLQPEDLTAQRPDRRLLGEEQPTRYLSRIPLMTTTGPPNRRRVTLADDLA